jgi:hypothetical protein
MLPDFIIIGARCCGTSSLYAYMVAHPNIAAAKRKEVHFYDDHWYDGQYWYRANFPLFSEKLLDGKLKSQPYLTGEASPFYLYHPLVPDRVKKLTPDARFLVSLRNPIRRAFSHYQQSKESGRERLSFEAAIDAETDRLKGEVEKNREEPGALNSRKMKHYSYVTRGHYAEQLEHWFERFPREQFLIFNSERLFRDTPATMARVWEFLGLPPYTEAEYPPYHVGGYTEKVAPETHARLREYYAPHNERLYALLGERYDWE